MAKKTTVTVHKNSGRRWEASARVDKNPIHLVVIGGKSDWKLRITTGKGKLATEETKELVAENRADAIKQALDIAGVGDHTIVNPI